LLQLGFTGIRGALALQPPLLTRSSGEAFYFAGVGVATTSHRTGLTLYLQ